MEIENEKFFIEHEKLMKRSNILVISFFLFFAFDLYFFIYFQTNPLFMFNLNRSTENLPNALLSGIFALVLYTIVALAVIFYLWFLVLYLKKYYRVNYKLYQKIQQILDFFHVVPTFLFVVILVNGWFFSVAKVDGSSMYPAFENEDTVVISFQSTLIRRDVIIIQQEENFLVKRLVGLPGDKLKVDETGVYINDQLVESFVPDFESIYYDKVLAENEYYVLGDNRTISLDSRYFGIVLEEQILGEVILEMNP